MISEDELASLSDSEYAQYLEDLGRISLTATIGIIAHLLMPQGSMPEDPNWRISPRDRIFKEALVALACLRELQSGAISAKKALALFDNFKELTDEKFWVALVQTVVQMRPLPVEVAIFYLEGQIQLAAKRDQSEVMN